MPFNLGPFELIIILVIILLVFGVGRLPEVGGALGKSIKEFRKATVVPEDDAATARKEAAGSEVNETPHIKA